jgi:hypothetical protein
LISIEHPSGESIKNAQVVRLAMDWRTLKNHVDCGVFLMRHMETYKGDDVIAWQVECGLCNEEEGDNVQQKQLYDLRRKYVAKILMHKINENKMWVIQDMEKWVKLTAEEKINLYKTSYKRIAERIREGAGC